MRATLRVVIGVLLVAAIVPAIDRTIVLLHPGGRASWDVLTRFIDFVHPARPLPPALSPEEIGVLDERYALHRAKTLAHVIFGGLFLLGATLQISPRFRARHLALHRSLGRVLLIAAAIAALTGIYFGAVIPVAGFGEASSVVFAGAFLLFAAVRGFLAVRGGDLVRHREWMIRVFAVAIGVAVIRLLGVVMIALRPLTTVELIPPSFWSGFVVSIAAGELWIRAAANELHRPRGENAGARVDHRDAETAA